MLLVFALIFSVAALIFSLTILILRYTQSQPTYTNLTEEQVISYIQVYGLAGMVDGYIVPIGEWAAVEESPGKWRIRGEISLGDSRRYSGTWIFDNGTIISPRFPGQENSTENYTIPRFP